MHAGKMQTEYGRAVCDVLLCQVFAMTQRFHEGLVQTSPEYLDLVEIKRVLMGMRMVAPAKRKP